MYRVLLTGFAPFGEFRSNPTQIIVEQFSANLSGIAVYCSVLPVDFTTVPAYYHRLLEAVQPHFILNLGLAAGGSVLQPEKTAYNLGYDRYKQPKSSFKLIASAPDAYVTSLPIEQLAEQLCLKQIPAMPSYYAGNYLCNLVYFFSLHWCAAHKQSRALFMHMPLSCSQAAQGCLIERKPYASLPLTMLQGAVVFTIGWGVKQLPHSS